MKIYRSVVRPIKSNDWYEEPIPPSTTITVHESDERGRPTGILDHRGNPIMSFNQTGKIGFVAKE